MIRILFIFETVISDLIDAELRRTTDMLSGILKV